MTYELHRRAQDFVSGTAHIIKQPDRTINSQLISLIMAYYR